MKEPHKILWLQWEGDGEGEVTWCRDMINEDDVEYIRSDLHEAQLAALSWARWISVEERLPEEDGEYLAAWLGYKEDRWTGELNYNKRRNEWSDNTEDTHIYTVYKWMPLPPAPEQVNK